LRHDQRQWVEKEIHANRVALNMIVQEIVEQIVDPMEVVFAVVAAEYSFPLQLQWVSDSPIVQF
jgi:hypothetical protein